MSASDAQMPQKPALLPYPRSLVFHEGTATVTETAISFVQNPDILPQGYRLTIGPEGAQVDFSDEVGAYYARLTFRQLAAFYGPALPALTIDDAPDFARRGVMLDCSRDRVPHMKTLYALIDMLAAWKINEFQLYIEHTFAFDGHHDVWQHASPFTPAEIDALADYCRQRHIDLVPCQASLGHMERWLEHPRYAHLAEAPHGFIAPWETLGYRRPPSTLCPGDPQSFALVAELFDQLLPHYHSNYVNICGDEPFELGMGRSKADVEERGGQVYFEYLMKVQKHVAAKGRRVQFWADIITKYPELIPDLSGDMIPLVWGYESYEPAERQCEMVSETGQDFYVCPGTSSWNSLVGRTDNTIANHANAAALGLKYNALGYLNTDWGDNGHMQPLPSSYLGFIVGAGMGWCVETNCEADLPTLLDRFAFADRAGVMGRIAYDLGNIYQLIPFPQFNGSWMFRALEYAGSELSARYHDLIANHGAEPLTPEVLLSAMARIESLIADLAGADMEQEDALIKAEFKQAGRLLIHGAKRTLRLIEAPNAPSDIEMRAELKGLIADQRTLWLERSRSGGLDDSLARLQRLLADY